LIRFAGMLLDVKRASFVRFQREYRAYVYAKRSSNTSSTKLRAIIDGSFPDPRADSFFACNRKFSIIRAWRYRMRFRTDDSKRVKRKSRYLTDENGALKDNNWRRSSSSRVTSQASIKTLSHYMAQIQRQSCKARSVFKVRHSVLRAVAYTVRYRRGGKRN